MWDDESGWNAYADNSGGDMGASNPYAGDAQMWSDYSPPATTDMGWNSQDYHYGQDQPVQQNVYSNPIRQTDQYNWSPQYQSGAAWNPSATQITSGNPSVEELYNRVGGMEGATFYRNQPGMVNDPQLRDVEHYAAAQEAMKNPLIGGNPLGRMVGTALPPAYSLAKYMAQNAPPWLRGYLPSYFTQASPPSWMEAWSGMKPFLRP